MAMESNLVQWLDAVGSRVFGICVVLLVVTNVAGVAMVAIKRDRAMVNRWTPRFLGANLALLATGLGVPAITMVGKIAVHAIAPMISPSVPATLNAAGDDDRASGQAVDIPQRER
jgi:hypothetical protein